MLNSYNLYIDKLNSEYKETFNKISNYVHANNADEIKNEEILSEVMDSFLEAQNSGKSVNQVTGNLESFCRQLCSEIGIKSKIINFVEMLHPMFLAIIFFYILDLTDMITRLPDIEGFNFFTYRGSHSILAYFLGALIVIASNYIGKAVAKKYVFSHPEKYKRITFAVTVFSFVMGIVAYLLGNVDTDANNGTLLWVTILCCIAFMIVYRLLTHESRRYSVATILA